MDLKINQQAPCEKIIMRRCHLCGKINESARELQNCTGCHKGFLPLNYLNKIAHNSNNSADFHLMFEPSNALDEDDMIKGIFVLW